MATTAKPASLQQQQQPGRRSSSGGPNTGGPLKLSIDDWGAVYVPSAAAPGCAAMPPTRFENTRYKVSMYQHMGDRKTQEDRFLLVPNLANQEATAQDLPGLFGVFDGTVGDFASENVKDIVVPTLLELEDWKNLSRSKTPEEQGAMLEECVKNMFLISDKKLLERCSRHQQHYATCTGVTVLMAHGYMLLGHLGDSRIVLGFERNGEVEAWQGTQDHKPDQEPERKRIEECGGMVERLVNHNNKPFIRGGDFMMRKALGEQPMQLQYSRAFGGKDLKIFGLSSTPTVTRVKMMEKGRQVKWAILASDGLWDICSAETAVKKAIEATANGHDPATALVRHALFEQKQKNARADNITVVCIEFDSVKPGA